MKKILVYASCIIYSAGLQSQPVRSSLNIPYLSSAQLSPELANPLSVNDNPSVIPLYKGSGFGIYSEKKFMTEGLNTLFVAAAIFRIKTSMGINFLYFGNPQYNEIKAGINYGRSLGKVIIGMGISYSRLSIAGFESYSSLSVTVSGSWKLSENIYSGVLVCNPHISNRQNGRLTSVYKTGFGYEASSKVYAGFEIVKEENKPTAVITILQYRFADQFFARAGFISGSSAPFFGAGWQWKYVRLELMASQHYALGPSPAILFNYIKKNQE